VDPRAGAERLPPELFEFFALTEPQTLLVRGPPGSGKTMLSQTILEVLPAQKIYVSTRVRKKNLVKQFPALAGLADHGHFIVDATDSALSRPDPAHLQSAIRGLLKNPHEAGELARFVWLPPAIQEAWSQLDPRKLALVVVDSWDALVDQYLGRHAPSETALPDRAEVERLLVDRMSESRAHLVLVQERDGPTAFDYLADGIAVTSRESVDGRLERWLTFPKLRGIAVENDTYPFTLHRGRFAVLPPFRLRNGRVRSVPEPEHRPGFLWPGVAAFADQFGWLPQGRPSLVEYDPDIPFAFLPLLLGPAIHATLRAGGYVVITPPPWRPLKDVWAAYAEGTPPEDRVIDRLRVAAPAPPEDEQLKKIAMDVGGPGGFSDRMIMLGKAITFLHPASEKGVPSLLILSATGSTTANSSGPTDPRWSSLDAELQQRILKESHLHACVTGSTGNPLVEDLKTTASIHILARWRQGRVLLYGVKPRTRGYALVDQPENEREQFSLIEIV